MKPAGDMKPTAAGAEFSRRAARRIFGIAMAVALLPGEGHVSIGADRVDEALDGLLSG